MKKLLFIILLFLLCLLFSMPVMAQIYKYETADGQVFYTNDYAQIPVEHRGQITGYDETVGSGQGMAEEEALTQETIEAKRQGLAATSQELNETFQSLTKRQQDLESRRDSIPLDNDEALVEYNSQMAELNLEIDHYKRLSEVYVKEVEDFNRKIEDYNKKSLGKTPF